MTSSSFGLRPSAFLASDEMFEEEKSSLLPVPPHPYDIGAISPVRASSRFRITVDANHYSVPAEYAGARLTLKSYPDRLCLYHEGRLIARHVRSYDRNRDFEDPDHPKELYPRNEKKPVTKRSSRASSPCLPTRRTTTTSWRRNG